MLHTIFETVNHMSQLQNKAVAALPKLVLLLLLLLLL
jgi:hypothetical protein